MTYSTSDPHYLSWNGFWLNAADPVGGYSDAIDTMMEFEACLQPAPTRTLSHETDVRNYVASLQPA